MNISTGKGDAWRQGQWPSAEDLAAIAEKLGFSYRWLVTGEGDPEGADAPPALPPCTGSAAEESRQVRELEEKVRLQQELLDAKDKIIALLSERQAEDQTVFSRKDTSVPTSPGAAPSARQDNK